MEAASLPYTILRATQFFEFIGRIADSSMQGDTVHLPPVLVQPEAADDVAAALAEIAVSAPVNGIVELAGPEQFRFDELARRFLSAKNDPRLVEADVARPLLRCGARRALPDPRKQRTHRSDPLRGLAGPVRSRVNDPHNRRECS